MSSETAFRRFMLLGSVLGGLAVAAGAFYDTAARYQLYHAIAIVLTGLAVRVCDDARLAAAGWMFATGILLFCGSLYVVALFDIRWMGAITPLGGVALMIGWSLLGWRAWTSSTQSV